MKAVICTRYGPPEVLRLAEVAKPEPRRGQVRIRIRATAVTASDTLVRGLKVPPRYRLLIRLLFGWKAPRRPILGMVLAGEIDSLGRNVSAFKVGDPVFGLTQRWFGTNAQYVCWPADGVLATRPANLTCEEAAALPYGGLIALFFMRRAGIRAGQHVLVYGASGAIGTAAVQLIRQRGARVTGVCSTANLQLVESLGAGAVIDYTREDFTRGPERYDVIFDAVGRRKSARALADAQRALAPGGKVVSVDDAFPRLLPADLVVLRDLAESGALKPVIDRSYPLEEMVEAHRYVDGGHKKGNVIVTVDHTSG
ncbi:MAG TPA: NAD(P)-dependent alcohol dehydrogenase [Longimicrobium sp.]|nr:NAD(P)-dependent alcohol dehydrogenase [Longimicrobium sp.]